MLGKETVLALIYTICTSHESAIASFLIALVVLVSFWDIFLRSIVYALWCDFLRKVL